MKLEGVVGACELADIFQLLSSTARKGVLVVSKGRARRRLYFGPEGVTLFFDANREAHLLGQILLGRGLVDEEALEVALDEQQVTGRPLGEILCRLRGLRPAQVEEALAYQLREELFHLLTWQNARFEFHEGEERPLDPGRSYTRTPSFNTDSVIMEAARRADEWQRIRLVITSKEAIPLRVSESPVLTDEVAEDEIAHAVLDLADGTFSMQQMVKTLGLSEFDVYECTFGLLGAGVVRLADSKELIDLAAAALTHDKDRARRLLLNAAASCADDLKLRFDIGTMFIAAGDEREAGRNLDVLLRYLVEKRSFGQADQMLDQIGSEFPNAPYSYERRLRLLDGQKDFAPAYTLAARLLKLYDRRGDAEAARKMLRHLDGFTVTGVDDLIRLARLLESEGQTIAAARRYYLAANRLRHAGKRQEAIRLCRKALRLDSRRAVAREELEYLLSASRRRWRRIGIRALGLAAAVLVMLGGVWVVHRERLAEKDLTRATLLADSFLSQKEYDQACEVYAGLRVQHPFTTVSAEAGRRLAEIERRKSVHLAAAAEDEQQVGKRAQEAEGRLDLKGAASAYEQLASVALSEQVKHEAEEHATRLRAELNEYGRLVSEARTHEREGRYVQALGSYLAARERSRRLFDHDGIGLPLFVGSTPPGAQVTRGGQVLGITPLVLHRDVGEDVALVLRRTGAYETAVAVAWADRRATVSVELVPSRRALWTFQRQGAIDEAPQIVGNACYVVSRDGKLTALQLENGKVAWQQNLGTRAGEYVSRPLPVGEGLLTATMDGSVIAFSQATGERLWHRKGQGMLALAPVYLESEKAVGLVYPSGRVEVIDPVKGSTRRTVSMSGTVGSRAVSRGDMLYLSTADGVRALDLRTATCLWQRRLSRPLRSAMGYSAGTLYVALEGSGLTALRGRDGELLWRFDRSEGEVLGVSADAQHVFAATWNGRLAALEAQNGRLLWRAQVDGHVAAAPVAAGDQVLVATTERLFSAFRRSDGRLLWKTDLAGPVTAPPVVAQDRVLVTTEGGRVQAFSLR